MDASALTLVLYLGVEALGQISSNKSAAQGLIAQTDNALIQCSGVSGCCCCWLVYINHWVWFGAASDVNQHTNYWEMCLLLILRRNTVTSASDCCWITVRLPCSLGGSVYPSGTFRCNHSANRGRQAGGSHGMWYLITRALSQSRDEAVRPSAFDFGQSINIWALPRALAQVN